MKIIFSIRPISRNAVAKLFCSAYDPSLTMMRIADIVTSRKEGAKRKHSA